MFLASASRLSTAAFDIGAKPPQRRLEREVLGLPFQDVQALQDRGMPASIMVANWREKTTQRLQLGSAHPLKRQ